MRLLVICAALILCISTKHVHSKTGQVLLSAEQIAQARENVKNIDARREALEKEKESVQWIMDMSDEEIWEFIPSAEQVRALNVRFGVGCPIHGAEIFKKGGHYPWIMDREHPYKVKCPIGGEVYPSNDFDAWNKSGRKEKLDTSQPYVDDGYGWIDAEGNRYFFVAHYNFWQRWRTDILPVVPRLSQIYTLTGDTRYSHKAAVMLARIASEYPKMDYTKQGYHLTWPSIYVGKILDRCWEGDGTAMPLTRAYDEVYPSLDSDAELKEFLAKKNIGDSKHLIETDFLQQAARAIFDGVIQGNMNQQNQLAIIAAVLDNNDPSKGLTTQQMTDWIMNGDGEMSTLLYNGICRDGSAAEESIDYMGIWASAFLSLAESLKPLGYNLHENPRLKKMIDFYIQTAVAGRFCPCIGDDRGSMIGGKSPDWSRYLFKKAYDIWGSAEHAKVLNHVGWPSPSIYEKPDSVDRQKESVKELGSDLGLKSRNLGGYGLAIFEAGKGDDKRAMVMHYGTSGAWHGHYDRLNLEMWAHGTCVLPDMGYPAHWGDKAYTWTQSTPSHYCVQIDENRQYKMTGNLHLFAVSPDVQLMDASAEVAYSDQAELYRRTVAMVDISETDSYLLDIFRVKGGKVHDYIFHGLPFGEFSVAGVTLGKPQAKGTLAGEDIEFGQEAPGKSGGYQWLKSPRSGKTASNWSANWFVKEKDLGLKMTMLGGCASEVIVADGEPEAFPGYPDKMEYVLARNRTDSSAYVSIIEPYKSKPGIGRILPLTPDKDASESLVAVKVGLAGRTDYLFSDIDRTHSASFGSGMIDFEGTFGSISEDNSGLRSIYLVNGSLLRKAECSIRMAENPPAKITAVDYRANTITVDREVLASDALVGQVIVISNPKHSASFTVKSARVASGQTVLELDVSMIEGIGALKSIDEKNKVVESSNRLDGYGIKWMGQRIPGRALVNESMTGSWLIDKYDDSKWHIIASQDIEPEIASADGKPSRYFYIGEASVGDDVMIPAIASVVRNGKGYTFGGSVPFEFTDPTGKIIKVTAKTLGKQG